VIDVTREQKKNACDLMRVNFDSVSNEIDESELHFSNPPQQRI
jgi:hypothetical protein